MRHFRVHLLLLVIQSKKHLKECQYQSLSDKELGVIHALNIHVFLNLDFLNDVQKLYNSLIQIHKHNLFLQHPLYARPLRIKAIDF